MSLRIGVEPLYANLGVRAKLCLVLMSKCSRKKTRSGNGISILNLPKRVKTNGHFALQLTDSATASVLVCCSVSSSKIDVCWHIQDHTAL